MNKPEYWKWIKDIWENPLDATRREVFADWLQEQGCEKAARRQRQYATWVRATVAAVRGIRTETLWLFVDKTNGETVLMRVKKDTTVHPMPRGMIPSLYGTDYQYLKRAKR